MKNKLTILFTTLLIILCLCGCTRQEYSVNINEQNGVDFQVKILVDKDSYNLLSTFNVDLNELEKNKVDNTASTVDKVNPLFQETAMKFKKFGFEITDINDAVELGFSAKKSYLTIEEFNEEIINLCNENLSGLNLDIQYTDTKTNKRYQAYGTLNYVVDKDLCFDDPVIKEYFDKQYETDNLTCKAVIKVPITTQITATDGTGSGEGIEWIASYNSGIVDVHVISEYHDNSMYYMIAFVAIIILAVIAFFLLRAMKFKKEKENSALKDEYEYEKSEDAQ